MRRRISIGTLTASVLALSGCGHAAQRSEIAARVGDSVITQGSVEHWMKVIAPGHVVPDPPRYARCRRARRDRPASGAECAHELQSLKQRALRFLIASYWLVGEAADQGLPISGQEVRDRVASRSKAAAEEGSSLAEEDAAAGRSLADVELELQSELAAQGLRRRIEQAVRPVSPAEIARFYRRHLDNFKQRERRYFHIAEDLTSLTAAQRLKNEILRGRNIATTSLSESMERRPHQLSSPAIVKAIFTAHPGELVGPIGVNHIRYYLIKLDRIMPASTRTLAQATPTIAKHLAHEHTHNAIKTFISAATAKWTAQTDCLPNYIAPGCKQLNEHDTQRTFTLNPATILD